MDLSRLRILAVAPFVAVGVCAGGCGDGADSGAAEERAVLDVVREGRQAIIDDKPSKLCGLLTQRARRNSLIAESDEYRDNGIGGVGGGNRPRPKTCARGVGDQVDFAREDGPIRQQLGGPELRARVVRISGRRAHVRLGEDTRTDIYLVKTRAGWRADYANFSPFDGSSGY